MSTDRQRVWSVLGANRGIRRVILALAGSTVGYWGYTIALLVYAHDEGGAFLVGVAAFVRLFPAAIASPIAGAIADRHARERVLFAGDLARMATLGCAAVAVALDAPVALVLTLVAVNAAFYASFRPAMRALTPSLARTPDELTAVNIMASTVESLGMLAGPAAGGILLAATSPAAVFAASAVTLAWSAAMVSAIRVPAAEPRATETVRLRVLVVDGLRACARERDVRLVLLLTAGQTLTYGALSVLTVLVVADLLGTGDAWVGYLNAAAGLGGVLGALAVAPAITTRLGVAAGVGLASAGLPLCLIAAWPQTGVALVAITAVGVANTVIDVSLNTLLQRVSPPAALARVFSVLGMVVTGTVALGGLLAPVLVHALDVRGALAVTGALLPLLALARWRALRGLQERAVASPDADLLARLRVFAEVPRIGLEHLVRVAAPARAAAGATVVTQGEPGELFYVVVSGRVEVSTDGKRLGELGAGEAFGEIALLRDVPRTATVRAVTDLELLTLGRDDFIAAVVGAASSSATAIEGVLAGALVLQRRSRSSA